MHLFFAFFVVSMHDANCPAIRGRWARGSSAEVQFVHRALHSVPLFMAEAFAPALMLYHPPRGLRDGGLSPQCNRTQRQVSRTGQCDMLRVARQFVRNATFPPTARRFARCAVVGSGSHMLTRRLGACIDGHDAVVRLNDAPVEPRYGEDVGLRTTWRLSTMQSWVDAVKRRAPALKADAQLLFCLEPWVGECFHKGLSGRVGGQRASMINPELVGQAQIATFALAQQVQQQAHDWQFSKYFGHSPYPPTTGMLALFAALSSCEQVNAFGFTVNNSRTPDRGGCAKYYVGREGKAARARAKGTAQKPPGKCMSAGAYFGKEGFYHDWSMQMRALQRMEALGLLTIVG